MTEDQFQELEELEAWAEQQTLLGLSPVYVLVPDTLSASEARGRLQRFREILEGRQAEADRRIAEYSSAPTNLADAELAELARLDPDYEGDEW